MLKKRFVDLSIALGDECDERLPVQIEYFDHKMGASQMSEIFGVPATDLPDGLGWAGERITLLTHSGTHMDAPYHYGPSSNGAPAQTIDQIPLEWCCGNGVVLDMSEKANGGQITINDLEASLKTIDYNLQENDIVLIRTGASGYLKSPEYPDKGVGLGWESTLWLLNRGVHVIGTDAWGLDQPFSRMRQAYESSGNPSVIWPSHYAGRIIPYLQLEKLTNLEQLPPIGFTIYCFPINIRKASAGWCRVVAEI